jgi:predicted enzyme related to lactoylglutathione lyase
VTVTEAFFAVPVVEMERTTNFSVTAFDADVAYASTDWSSPWIAGVRVALSREPDRTGTGIGLHSNVDDLATACRAVANAGDRVVEGPFEPQEGVTIARVADTETNEFVVGLAT